MLKKSAEQLTTGARPQRAARGNRLGHRLQRIRQHGWQRLEGVASGPVAMARNAVLDCGWGRLLFAQTFETPAAVVEALGAEGPQRRDIAFRRCENLFCLPQIGARGDAAPQACARQFDAPPCVRRGNLGDAEKLCVGRIGCPGRSYVGHKAKAHGSRCGFGGQRPLPLRWGGVSPTREGLTGRRHGPMNILGARDGRRREYLSGGGVDKVGVAAVDGLGVRPGHEVAQHLLVDHAFASRTSERNSVQTHLRHCFRCKQVLPTTESVAESACDASGSGAMNGLGARG